MIIVQHKLSLEVYADPSLTISLLCPKSFFVFLQCLNLKHLLQWFSQWPDVLKTNYIAERVPLFFTLHFVFKLNARIIYCYYYKINTKIIRHILPTILYYIVLIFIIFHREFNYFHEFLSILFINLHYLLFYSYSLLLFR